MELIDSDTRVPDYAALHTTVPAAPLARFGGRGDGDGCFKDVKSIAVARDGSYWVVSPQNSFVSTALPRSICLFAL